VAERDERAAAAPPDTTKVNASWPAAAVTGPGLGGLLSRLLARLLGPQLEAQRTFNAEQVRLDNALVGHLDERLAATHRHYDRILGETGRRLEEVDARHAQLARDLVTHVHDLARRIDLVLIESERGRPALEHALAELRERLARLEERLREERR
jgi:septal ring factor EnvC (AmiA/AmiB activator)